MKLIDAEVKGNLIRFYLGDDPLFHGDDWNDIPYQDNAGPVYEEYVKKTVDLAIPFDYLVVEPKCNESEWSKNDMKDGLVPMLVIVKEDEDDYGYITYFDAVSRIGSHRIYMNTEFKKEDFKDYILIN
ncbi:MAG: hypothetical protein Q4B60_09045 [Erysipelotrichaceae bacterium]|nr:hypothetical protein [Erysipelotrichaceae bacterium]